MVGLKCLYSHPGISQVPWSRSRWQAFSDLGRPSLRALALVLGNGAAGVSVGFGPFAGVLTLVVYSIGFVAKMLAERIEEIDFGQVEAMRAAGAPYLSTLVYAIFPQIMPRQIGLTIYQLDSNLRASAVVGIVGAGGIGATLANAFGRYDYDFALAITIAPAKVYTSTRTC